jgi:hypothetical protein
MEIMETKLHHKEREGERQAERKKVRQRETERQKDRDREIIIIRNKVNRVSVGLILIPYEANPFESD